MQDKIRRLIENVGWMSISNFGSKILIFLLVPFYTRVLTTEEYGSYDMVYTAVLLCAPFLTASISEAVMRFVLASPETSDDIYSAGQLVSFVGSVVALASAALVWWILPVDGVLKCYYLFGVGIFVTDTQYALHSRFARAIGQMKCMAIGSLIQAASLVVFSVTFLIPLQMGVNGYFFATMLSNIVAAVYMLVGCRAWQYLKRPNKAQVRELVSYGMPLGVNTAGWWANNVLGRYMTAIFLGVSGTGLLAAAYKIPSIPKTIQQVFVQAWQVSSVQEFGDDDSPEFFSRVYNVMCIASALLASVVTFCMPLLAIVMFSDEFYVAWKIVPLLMLGVVFDCLASIVGGVFSAVGDSKPFATSAIASVVVAALTCLVLIPVIGVYGAAISSVLSSITIWAIRLYLSRKHMTFPIDWLSNAICFLVLAVQIAFAFRLEVGPIWFAPQVVCTLLQVALLAKQLDIRALLKARR